MGEDAGGFGVAVEALEGEAQVDVGEREEEGGEDEGGYCELEMSIGGFDMRSRDLLGISWLSVL